MGDGDSSDVVRDACTSVLCILFGSVGPFFILVAVRYPAGLCASS